MSHEYEDNRMADRFVLEPERFEITQISRRQCYRLESEGKFPPRRQISPGRIGWPYSEIKKWLETRPTGPASNRPVGLWAKRQVAA